MSVDRVSGRPSRHPPSGSVRGAHGPLSSPSAKRAPASTPTTLAPAVAGVCVAAIVVQAVLGWGLGIVGAGIPVVVGASLVGALVVADGHGGVDGEAAEARYDVAACAAVAVAVAIAVACLYLPLPWGGLTAAAVVTALVAALRAR